MYDLRPVGYVTGLLLTALGVSMLVPFFTDLALDTGNAWAFFEAATITGLVGLLSAVACANGVTQRLSIQQTFLMAVGVWLFLPAFGALPFWMGATQATYIDALFEAMSGLTTTGATVFTGLDQLPAGLQLWRSMLQWFGGIGIIVVAMVFLPELRVGGMQIFRSEGFDTMGKILPRAAEIAQQISIIYLGLTVACILGYLLVGMPAFDALNHAFTTVSTGGFSTHDASFGAFQGAPEYVAVIFIILASLPFVRYVQILAGSAEPLWRDSQVRAFIAMIAVITLTMASFRVLLAGDGTEAAFRQALFNVTSIISGTGFSSTDYQLWGPLAVVIFFFLGLVGGCAGSTCCSIKIFRYQILISAVRAQIRRIHSPNGLFSAKYEGRRVSEDVLNSVMAFFVMFTVSVGIVSVLLGLTGLDMVTSLSGSAAALANIGPGLGPIIGPSGTYAPLNDTAKWILTAAMLIGRLELMAVFVLFTRRFWMD
jgi:trk system potassium uptake protein TrkH